MEHIQKVRTRITENHSITIAGSELRELINKELERGGNKPLPSDASLSVQVPGGGDWSNMSLDLNEYPIEIEWTIEKAEGDL